MEVKNLERHRKAFHNGTGITLEELAAKCVLSYSTVYKMEKGKPCSRNSIKRVADVLKVKMCELVGVE